MLLATVRTLRPSPLLRRYLSSPSSPIDVSLSTSPTIPGLSFLSLSRPAAKNAISQSLLAQLRHNLDLIRSSSTRVLILQSTVPGVFCAGADLRERRTMSPADIATFLRGLRLALGELEGLQVPTIAALDGVALGGGLELALACDFRVAGAGATKLGLPETRLAIIPGAGGTQRMTRLVGVTKAKELIFSARTLTAVQALEIGLVSYVAAEGQTATERAIQLAEEFLPAGPLALRAAKRAIDTGSRLDLESGLDLEYLCYQGIMPSKDRLEGLAAFAEKRKPVYKGE